MKNTKNIASVLYCVSAVCFYICAAIEFFSGDKTSMAIMHLCLGSTFICLAATNRKNGSEDDTKAEEDKKDEENK